MHLSLKTVTSILTTAFFLTGCQALSQKLTAPTAADTAQVVAAHKAAPTPPESTAQKPAELDEAPPADLWQLTRDNFGLNLTQMNPRIEQQLRWYASHPQYLDRVSARAQRYYYYILSEVLKRGMPAELALLPIVESAYDPFAYSHGRAAGPWQFIPSTGKHFGLKKTWWYDGRRDLVASTDAALTYLQRLYHRFGDWELALAAYNAGGGNVNRALRKNREAGKATDFWSLQLPDETQAYVPKLLALAKLIQQPDAYGISLNPIPNQPFFELVETQGQIDLAQAAELAGIPTGELYLLNPGFNRWATDPQGPHHLAIPVANAERFRQALIALPVEERVKWQRYPIKRGDSLISIAKQHRTTVDVIRTANNIKGNAIRAGQVLLVPTASRQASDYVHSQAQRLQRKQQTIARNSARQKTVHQVAAGESFWTIAKKHQVGVGQLAAWNNMAPGDPLPVGKRLYVWHDKPASLSSTAVIRKIGYKVRSGDSLARIAGHFNVSVKNILSWNQLDIGNYLQPGQQLTLYVDVTKAN